MRALVQRVKYAKLNVDGQLISKIDNGLIVFLGVKCGDTDKELDYIVNKVANLRIFEDGQGKMNLSVKDIEGGILAVSQFTLYGDLAKGFRPSFTQAEKPEIAIKTYDSFIDKLKKEGITVKSGVFGADMKIEYLNDGPVSIMIFKEKNREGKNDR